MFKYPNKILMKLNFISSPGRRKPPKASFSVTQGGAGNQKSCLCLRSPWRIEGHLILTLYIYKCLFSNYYFHSFSIWKLDEKKIIFSPVLHHCGPRIVKIYRNRKTGNYSLAAKLVSKFNCGWGTSQQQLNLNYNFILALEIFFL